MLTDQRDARHLRKYSEMMGRVKIEDTPQPSSSACSAYTPHGPLPTPRGMSLT